MYVVLAGFIGNLPISVVRLGKCRRREVAVDAAREGKGDPAWFNVATVAPKYHEIKRKELQSSTAWSTHVL